MNLRTRFSCNGHRLLGLALIIATHATLTHAAQAQLTTLYSFSGPDGISPYAGLVRGGDGNFYGTTETGGVNGYGTVFRVTATGALTTLYSFGELNGSVSGINPYGPLTLGNDGNLYGTTNKGGPNAGGTLFQVGYDGSLKTIYGFGDTVDLPQAGVVQGIDGSLYGTSKQGGVNGYGAVFQLKPDGTLVVLHSFSIPDGIVNSDGFLPTSGLVLGGDGSVYGSTGTGGPKGGGTIFSITPDGTFSTIYSFCSLINCLDGSDPGTLLMGQDGSLYGAAAGGGDNGLGTIFRATTDGGVTTIYSFRGLDGVAPIGPLLQGSDGLLYGTTVYGGNTYISNATGQNGVGTIFGISAAGALAISYSFPDFSFGESEAANAGLIQGIDGSIYGTTALAGNNYEGTIFKLVTGAPPPLLPVTILDPVPQLLSGPQITSARGVLASQGRAVAGIAADGIAQLVFRVPTRNPGDQVTAKIYNDQCANPATCSPSTSSDDNGGLFNVGNAVTSAESLPSTASDFSDNSTSDAFIAYRAPIDFARSTVTKDATAASRNVYVQFTYKTSSGAAYGSHIIPLTIVRAPLILIHGFNTDVTSWDTFLPLVNDTSIFSILKVNYGMPLYSRSRLTFTPLTPFDITATNPAIDLFLVHEWALRSHLGFSLNSTFVSADIQNFISQFALGNNAVGIPVAGVGVDIVAHSMGGDVARYLTVDLDYLAASNYAQGYIHKLITLGTPHFGTPQAILSVLPQSSCSRNLAAYAGNLFFSSASLASRGKIIGETIPGAAGELSGDGVGTNLSPALRTIKSEASTLATKGIDIPIAAIAGDIEPIKSNVTTALAAIYPNEQCPNDPLAQRYIGTKFDSIFDPLITSSNPNGGPGGPTNSQNGRENDGSVPISSALMNPTITTYSLCAPGQCFDGYTHSSGIAVFFAKPILPLGGGINYLQDNSGLVSKQAEVLLNTSISKYPFNVQPMP